MSLLSWNKLLSDQRCRPSKADDVDHRSEFERDFDRVVFSSSFRRLQDKTQVWPLEAHDFVRTRLTHSSEVATIGRSLVLGAFGQLRNQGSSPEVDPHHAAASVATACLLHDIGNPPFGHVGEDIIAGWFRKRCDAKDASAITLGGAPSELLDLTHFEGNAHALRVVTQLQTLGSRFGMNLTFGTLSTLMKYPWSSTDAQVTLDKNGKEKKRKFGHFHSERDLFERIRSETGLSDKARHPLTYFVDAADDIAYSVVDVEDGLKKGAFAYDEFRAAARTAGEPVHAFVEEHLHKRLKWLRANNDSTVKDRSQSELEQLAFQHFRVQSVGKLIGSVSRCFAERYQEIMEGSELGNLVTKCDLEKLVAFMQDFAGKHVYTQPEVVKTERAAKRVLEDLLDVLWEEGENSKLMRALVRNVDSDEGYATCSPEYRRCQRLADYVAGMTDTFAFSLHARLTGGRA